ncbi:MAG TPA: hypothetical protein VMU95_16865 [Trebonia sp.]|nr:hypothetical protein [Trebonia sp.]
MRKLSGGIAVMVGCVLGLGVAGCSSPTSHLVTDTRVRAYTSYQACLLTGAQGVSGSAAPAWAGMESASVATHAKVSYLAVRGPQTSGYATTYVATDVVQKCNLIIGDGTAEEGAVIASAARFRGTKFAVVGTTAGPVAGAPANVAVVAGNAAAIRSGVASLVERDAGDS